MEAVTEEKRKQLTWHNIPVCVYTHTHTHIYIYKTVYKFDIPYRIGVEINVEISDRQFGQRN